MIDIASFNKALKCVWIRKYLDESNKGKWKFFLMLSSKTLEAKLFFGTTLTLKTLKGLLTILALSERDSRDMVWIKLSRLDRNGRIFPHTKRMAQFFD